MHAYPFLRQSKTKLSSGMPKYLEIRRAHGKSALLDVCLHRSLSRFLCVLLQQSLCTFCYGEPNCKLITPAAVIRPFLGSHFV